MVHCFGVTASLRSQRLLRSKLRFSFAETGTWSLRAKDAVLSEGVTANCDCQHSVAGSRKQSIQQFFVPYSKTQTDERNHQLRIIGPHRRVYPHKERAKAFVQKIELTIERTVKANNMDLASKADLATVESKLSKTIYLVGLLQFLAIVSSVLVIVTFMLG